MRVAGLVWIILKGRMSRHIYNLNNTIPIMKDNHYCVIMAGGYGKRFWPICRETLPKQFLDITGNGNSFVRAAYDRCAGLFKPENIFIITLEKYRRLVEQQIPELPEKNLLLEPYGRKTGPCVAYSTYTILKREPNAVMTVMPSDLVISDNEQFTHTILKAMEYAEAHPVLMTLGVKPTHPDPNYGYIQIKGGEEAYSDDVPMKVKTFTEKPDAALAEVFWKSGEFFWNSGIFVWQASVIKEEMEKYMPNITNLFSGWKTTLGSTAEAVFIERVYTDSEKISIDNGVMEKTDIAWLFPARFGWSDIDNWETFYKHYANKDADNNACNSKNTCLENAEGNLIISQDKNKLMAIKGLKDYIVIDTEDVLMICPKNDEEYKGFLTRTAMPGYNEFR